MSCEKVKGTKNTQASFNDLSPRKPPKKIQQEKVKKTYCQLVSLPQNLPNTLKHLYLSHNQIISLQGLQHLRQLVSLNVSYNRLTQITQLTFLPNPQFMRRISLRMNHFEMGYEDYTVGLFSKLERLDDEIIPKMNDRREREQMSNVVSHHLLTFYHKTQLIRSCLLSELEQQSNKKSQSKNNSYGNIISHLASLYIYPDDSVLRAKSTQNLLEIVYSIVHSVQSSKLIVCDKVEDYIFRTHQYYKEICDSLLLIFSQKFNNSLKERLLKGKNYLQEFGRLGMFEAEHKVEVKMFGGGYNFQNSTSNPSKYMPKMDPNQIINHPMSYYAQFKQNLGPINGVTRWDKLVDAWKQNQDQKQEESVFEKIPLLVYERDYIESLVLIVLNRIGQILQLFNQVQRKKRTPKQISIDTKVQYKANQQMQDKETLKKYGSIVSFGRPDQVQILSNNMDAIIGQDINNYSLYQLNLVFKVLRGLRKRVKKRKNNKIP